MPTDPYQPPAAEARAETDGGHLPELLLGLCALLLLVIAAWCFYVSTALSTLSAQDATRIENIERLSRQIGSGQVAPNRDSMVEYFARTREFLLGDIGYQRSAQLNFMLVGASLGLLFLLQLTLVWRLRRRREQRLEVSPESHPPGR